MSKVEIDPEDREQVERLVRLMPEDWNLAGWLDEEPETLADSITGVATALRHFANPPKPEEPTGLYARVEDTRGRIWVRTAEQASVWRRECANGQGRRYLIPQDGCEDYAAIDAVKVLSEGVQPDEQ